jgi:hypothetical protein
LLFSDEKHVTCALSSFSPEGEFLEYIYFLKSILLWRGEIKENDGGGELNYDIL